MECMSTFIQGPVNLLMLTGADFRAVLHELAHNDKAGGNEKMNMLRVLPVTDGMTDKGVYALAANLNHRQFAKDEVRWREPALYTLMRCVAQNPKPQILNPQP